MVQIAYVNGLLRITRIQCRTIILSFKISERICVQSIRAKCVFQVWWFVYVSRATLFDSCFRLSEQWSYCDTLFCTNAASILGFHFIFDAYKFTRGTPCKFVLIIFKHLKFYFISNVMSQLKLYLLYSW